MSGLSFTKDGGYLISGSHDKTIRLWKVGSTEAISIFPLASICTTLIVEMPGDMAEHNEPVYVCGDYTGTIYLLKLKF